MNNVWLVPTVIVGMCGLALQGVKAAWDLYLGLAGHRRSRDSARLQEVGALMGLIEGLPLDQARRAYFKVEVIKLIESRADTASVYPLIRRAIETASGRREGD
jgi:hypothetical protein